MTNFDITDDAESKSITLYCKDTTLYWSEARDYAGRTGTKATVLQVDEESGCIIYFRSFNLSLDELVSAAEQVKIT